MSLPATRFALSHVGTAGNQGPHLAARLDPKVRGLFRCRQFDHRSVRTHDVRDLQRRNVPELSQAAAAPKDLRTTHDPCTRQRPLSSRLTPGHIFAPPRSRSAAAVSASIHPATCPDRASLETGPALGHAQPLLRNASRSAQSRQRLLRSLAPTEQSVAPLMLHYLRRCV
jgi:hypothetical protein